jgi:hypothetical protein
LKNAEREAAEKERGEPGGAHGFISVIEEKCLVVKEKWVDDTRRRLTATGRFAIVRLSRRSSVPARPQMMEFAFTTAASRLAVCPAAWWYWSP